MTAEAPDYDPRYLAGILFFNAQDFFEAHEVWEDLWGDNAGPDHRFYQGLIQAAVALYHFGNGNVRGAHRLFHSSHQYLKPYGAHHIGLHLDHFWEQMGRCFAEILVLTEPPAPATLDESLIPAIALEPPPETWPNPETFLEDKEGA